ncbi:Transcription initiation factor IIF subunit alpha [Aphelenchoides besseyi]|nr:Transcription initiation factor IIF subunit alpha [Aphelenchoides besseyi]KAI6220470.1 Transcription initiation factor IIF subunit alpha [Aphelenchoides besseyi]
MNVSDQKANSSRREEITVDEKIDRDMVGVGEEAGLNDESEDDDDEEEDGKKKLMKRLKQSEQANENDEDDKKLRLLDQVEQEKESSGSESDDPDNPGSKTSVLFMQLKDRKRALEGDNEAGGSEPKKSRDTTPAVNEPAVSTPPQQDGLDAATVRRLLTKRPHTTKELLNKLRPLSTDLSKNQIVARLAEILRQIQPHQFRRLVAKKEVLFFSMEQK